MNSFFRNNRYLFITTCLTLAAVPLASPSAQAAGIYLQEQSTAALGSAFAGTTSQVRNASILFYNPAGMTELDSAQIHGGMDVLWSKMDMQDSGSTLLGAPIAGVDSDDAIPVQYLPHLYAAAPVMDGKLWVGLAITAPFGLATEYHSDWYGRYDAQSSELITTDIQPSLAYEVTDWLSIGGGFNAQYIDAELSHAVTNGATEGRAKVSGSDWSYGYNIGAIIKPTDTTTLGIHYRSAMKHNLDGRVVVTGVAGLNEDSAAHAKADLPDILALGVSQELNDRWTLLGQANWFGWDNFDEVVIRRDTGTVAETLTNNYDTTWQIAIGAEYKATEDVTIRFGYQHDPTPSNDQFRNAKIPDGDRNTVAAGLTYDISERSSFDFGLTYSIMSDEDVSLSRNAGLAQVNVERQDTSFGFVSVGYTFRF